MALSYIATPVTASQKSAQAFAGEVDLNGNWFILDANGKEVMYIRQRPGLPSTVQARNAELATVVAALVVTINAL